MSRSLLLVAVLGAALLVPGCLNPFVEDEPPKVSQYRIRVTSTPAEPDSIFNLSREDLQDLLRAGTVTSDLNGLVQILDEVGGGIRPERFVRLGREPWIAGLDRFRELCEARAAGCEQYEFFVYWKGRSLQVTFERDLA